MDSNKAVIRAPRERAGRSAMRRVIKKQSGALAAKFWQTTADSNDLPASIKSGPLLLIERFQ